MSKALEVVHGAHGTLLDGYIPRLDAGWIYAVRSANFIKIGKTTDPRRRLLREANTWSPGHLEIIGVKPFWNIRKIEYSLHTALAMHWHRGEWHKFEIKDKYWMDFFVNAFQEFKDDNRDRNSSDFAYWMNGTNYAEIVGAQCEHRMSLPQWRACRADPWAHMRPT